jgi:NDP-sugar pyrophosphorylase family protein
MILAAGLGTRLQPLTSLRAKPALPIRGVPIIGYALAWLRANGVREVVINLHHLPDSVREAVELWRPTDLGVGYSYEPERLETGGGIRRVVEFLRESDPAIVIAGDMLFDLDLGAEIERHRQLRRRATLLLREDPRSALFGSIGIDGEGAVRRIATRFDLGGEVASGLYTSINLFSPEAFASMPKRERFNHLDDWLAPELRRGARDIVGSLVAPEASVWEPVGTLAEYLEANLAPPPLPYWPGDAPARERGVVFRESDAVVIGVDAELPERAVLRKTVVWDGERVPADTRADRGIFAGGRFVEVDTP